MQLIEKQQEQRRKDREAAIQAQIAAEMETEKEKDEDTITYKVRVSEFKCANPMHRNGIAALQIGDSLTSGTSSAAAQDPWVVVAKQAGGRWVADDVKYQQIILQDSIRADLQKIDGKKVLFTGLMDAPRSQPSAAAPTQSTSKATRKRTPSTPWRQSSPLWKT